MPSIKTMQYDGVIHLGDASAVDTLDLSGQLCIVNNGSGYAKGTTTALTCDGAVDSSGSGANVNTVISVGDLLYSGDLKFLGICTAVGTGDVTIGGGTKVALVDNEPICALPKFEIVAVQPITDTILTVAVPSENHYPGTLLAKGVGAWTDAGGQDYYGGTGSRIGAIMHTTATIIPAGAIIEIRWKKITVTTGDYCLAYVKAVPSRLHKKES